MAFSRPLLFFALVASAVVAWEIPHALRQLKLESCTVKEDCKSNCACIPFNGKTCVDLQAYSKYKSDCKKCAADSDCNARGCNNEHAICNSCLTESFAVGFRGCTDQPVAVTPAPGNCVQDSDCPVPGCGCEILGGARSCFDPKKLSTMLTSCKKCSADSDCDSQGCSASGYCTSCTVKAASSVKAACSNKAAPATPEPKPKSPPPKPQPTPLASEPEPSPTVVGEGDVAAETTPASVFSDTNSTTAAEKAPCVETAWLKKLDLMHAAIRHAPVARVLCVPGLPCGTPGHLLRQNGALVSYREVCETRSDCVESAVAVSQLSHTYDWSQYSAGSLQLTSLSAHPESNSRSASRIIAVVADALNKNGLGRVCNVVALAPFKAASALDKMMSLSAYGSS